MKKIGIFYGSSTGTTERIAGRVAALLGDDKADVHDVAQTAPDAVGQYDILVMGTSTWGDGEIQDDWYDFLDGLQALDLKGKKAAVFGCGDETMSETFCNGVDKLYETIKGTGADMIAPYDTIGYTFDNSEAKPSDAIDAVGLLLDEVNHPELTETRLRGWTAIIADAAK